MLVRRSDAVARGLSNGDQAALQKLLPLVNDELRRVAGRYMRKEGDDHTLQMLALVNGAFASGRPEEGAMAESGPILRDCGAVDASRPD